mmetsp:Transcript_39563/g.79902  ORF Transcript_39563/g.79902 Transcript_39563/m.79902 type:complete len:417 (+) Transcript_39563:116-1366(+)
MRRYGLVSYAIAAGTPDLGLGSSFDPHSYPTPKSALFEGWFGRIVDLQQNLSIATIIGTIRGVNTTTFNQTWSAALVSSGADGTASMVTTQAVASVPPIITPRSSDAKGAPSSFAFGWNDSASSGITVAFDVNDSVVSMDWSGRGAKSSTSTNSDVVLHFETTGPRVPWSVTAPNAAGPEGWLGLALPLQALPCHYYVHSLASPVAYTLTMPAEVTAESSTMTTATTTIQGTGLLHLEANYGAFFPDAWVWSQSASDANTQLLVAATYLREPPVLVPAEASSPPGAAGVSVGGSGLSLVAYRSLAFGALDFRSTDPGASVALASQDACAGTAVVAASSPRHNLVVELSAPLGTFSDPIFAPSRTGDFSDDPGAVESYAASVSATLTDAPTGEVLEVLAFSLSALEFGGGFRCQKVI